MVVVANGPRRQVNARARRGFLVATKGDVLGFRKVFTKISSVIEPPIRRNCATSETKTDSRRRLGNAASKRREAPRQFRGSKPQKAGALWTSMFRRFLCPFSFFFSTYLYSEVSSVFVKTRRRRRPCSEHRKRVLLGICGQAKANDEPRQSANDVPFGILLCAGLLVSLSGSRVGMERAAARAVCNGQINRGAGWLSDVESRVWHANMDLLAVGDREGITTC